MADKYVERFGEVVGHGVSATVYAKDGVAVKLYNQDYSKSYVFHEAYNMSNLESIGFPSPKIFEVLLIDGRYGIRMEQVAGKEALTYRHIRELTPAEYPAAVDALVDLQVELQKHTEVSQWTPDSKAIHRANLLQIQQLPEAMRTKLLEILEGLPDGEALNHGDFHGENIFIDGEKITIIDLLQMTHGDPAFDAICAYVDYWLNNPDFAEYYLNRYSEVSGIPREDIMPWLPFWAGVMMNNVPEHAERLKVLLTDELRALYEEGK